MPKVKTRLNKEAWPIKDMKENSRYACVCCIGAQAYSVRAICLTDGMS